MAAGGVGSIAVQLARWKGAHVMGQRREESSALRGWELTNRSITKRLVSRMLSTMWTAGARHAGRRYQKPLVEGAEKGGIWFRLFARRRRGTANHSVRSAFMSVHPVLHSWSEIQNSSIAGKLKPVVETVLPLSDARRAHELNETGHARGKTVLKVGYSVN